MIKFCLLIVSIFFLYGCSENSGQTVNEVDSSDDRGEELSSSSSWALSSAGDFFTLSATSSAVDGSASSSSRFIDGHDWVLITSSESYSSSDRVYSSEHLSSSESVVTPAIVGCLCVASSTVADLSIGGDVSWSVTDCSSESDIIQHRWVNISGKGVLASYAFEVAGESLAPIVVVKNADLDSVEVVCPEVVAVDAVITEEDE